MGYGNTENKTQRFKTAGIGFAFLFALHSTSAFANVSEKVETTIAPAAAQTAERHPASLEQASRLEHAKELLGKYYKVSVVKLGEKVSSVQSFIRHCTERALKGHWKKRSSAVARSIMGESVRYGFDPIFVMAVIENESSFVPTMHGSFGEIGLMQIKPDTAKWICKRYNIAWKGSRSLEDPVTNIQIGTAYLHYLRDHFQSHSRLYLSAYNMGSHNVHRALEKQIWPKDYVSRVMHRYIRFYNELGKALNDSNLTENEEEQTGPSRKLAGVVKHTDSLDARF